MPIEKIPACVDGREKHDFGINGEVCKFCGYDKKYKASSVRTAKERTRRIEPTLSRKEAQDAISMVLLAAQTVVITARPDLKEDALNPQERALLADALTDEAFESVAVKKFLTRIGKQQKHAKIIMVMIAIAMPRLARHGLIPASEELSDELIAQASTSTRPSGNSTIEQDSDFESVPVAAGGSPFTNRGNGFREIDPSIVVTETAPLRSSSENEDGRREFSNGSGSEVVPLHAESTSEQDRVEAGSSTRRSKARRTI